MTQIRRAVIPWFLVCAFVWVSSIGAVLGWPASAAAQTRPNAAPPVRWVPPLPGALLVVRRFDPPAVRWAAGHRGVDLAAAAGTVVRTAGAGVVSFAGILAGRGVVAVIHGELRTTYEPVAASVHTGDRVAAGDPLGVLHAGHDPARPSAGLLHWGLLRGAAYLDPMSLLSQPRPVRLLPRWGSETSGVIGAIGRAAPPAPTPATAVARTDARGNRRSGGAAALALVAGAGATVVLSRRPP